MFLLQNQSCKIFFIKIHPAHTADAAELLIFPFGVLTLLLTAAHTQLLSRGYSQLGKNSHQWVAVMIQEIIVQTQDLRDLCQHEISSQMTVNAYADHKHLPQLCYIQQHT